MRMLAALLVLSAPLLSQCIGIPFSMNGGPMQFQGTFTVSGGSVCCSGVIDIGGEQGSFGPCKPKSSHGGGIDWRITVDLDEATYVIWLHVDIQGKLTGAWYIAGSNMPDVPLYP